MSHASPKSIKEAFFAGHRGTSLMEINAVVGLVPLAALLFTATQSILQQHGTAASDTTTGARPLMHWKVLTVWKVAEMCAMVLPQIAVMMDMVAPATAAASAVVLVLIVICRTIRTLVGASRSTSDNLILQAAQSIGTQRARFLSKYRGAMMLSTCIAILAVDFRAFPRRFAKSDGFGSGVMDVGVGSFVVASGLVASSATKRPACSRASCLHILALIALGAARVVAVRGVGYHEAASEYGVHWNFFFTLAAVKILTTLASVPPRLAFPAGAAVVAMHEASLTWGGLQHVVHSPHRYPNLWSLNKEGLLSLPGYWALHLLAVGVGGFIHTSRASALQQVQSAIKTATSPWKPLAWWFLQLLIATILSWAALVAALVFITPISRRACNLPYVLWMLAFNLQVVVAFAAGSVISPTCDASLFEGLNQLSLPTFLAANLLTGLVNISIDTLAVTDWPARAIVVIYAALLCSSVLFFESA